MCPVGGGGLTCAVAGAVGVEMDVDEAVMSACAAVVGEGSEKVDSGRWLMAGRAL